MTSPPEVASGLHLSRGDSTSPIIMDSDEDIDAQVQEYIESQTDDQTEEQGEEGLETEFGHNKRAKRSGVWLEFKAINSSDGKVVAAVCLHCNRKYTINSDETTTSLKRHMAVCLRLAEKKAREKKQQLINFVPATSNSLVEPALHDGKFDMGRMKEAAAHWITMHEHPFNILEDEGFNIMQKRGMPEWKRIIRTAAKNDCVKVYEIEKKRLKNMLSKVSKVSLTTDLWKSKNQKIEYMVLTGHWIDSSWKFQKRVLNFVHFPPPYSGVVIADALYKCCKEWEIENKVYSVTLDNASNNDVAIRSLKEIFSRNKSLLGGGRLFHVRCCAHILNLVVKDGLEPIEDIIKSIRASVDFINRTPAKLMLFTEIVRQLQLPGNKLIHDCKTRWNSTYEMLNCALKFKEAFPRFRDRESSYNLCPSEEDWCKVEKVCSLLQPFWDVTDVISGSDYLTSNLFLVEVWKIKELLDKFEFHEDYFMRKMVEKMKMKFDKYWGECNMLMSIAVLLDPRV